MAVCQFSKGATYREMLLRFMGIEPGNYLLKGALQKSIERVKKAKKASTKEAKTRRKKIEYDKVKKQKRTEKIEGSTYKAGPF